MARFTKYLFVPVLILLATLEARAKESPGQSDSVQKHSPISLPQQFMKFHARSLLSESGGGQGQQGQNGDNQGENGGKPGGDNEGKEYKNQGQNGPKGDHSNQGDNEGHGQNGAKGGKDNNKGGWKGGDDEGHEGADHNGAKGGKDNKDGQKGGKDGNDGGEESDGQNRYTPPPPPTPPTIPSVSPTPPTPTPSSSFPPTPATPSPSTPTNPKEVSCKNRDDKYRECYNMKHWCPSNCPHDCQVECVTCKPVCKCDQPGAVCQDPRFIGGDGLTFYFHGKKDRDFCLVSDPNLHINAHFIGKRNENLTRDFTWVQSIAVLFDKHQLFLGALKTSTWDDSVDRLSLTFDGEPLFLPENEGARWLSPTARGLSITRVSDSNSVTIKVERLFKITAKVVPITEEDSRIHNYGITKDDCFAHLDLRFKFYSLSNQVNGVLGQTYRPGYMSQVNVGAKMSVMGGHRDFKTTSLFVPDCAVTQFTGRKSRDDDSMEAFELPILSCASGMSGRGVVCKR